MSSNNHRSKQESGTDKKSATKDNDGKAVKSARDDNAGSAAGDKAAAPGKQGHSSSHKNDGKK
ncbi:hypothetical protein Herbaro_02695 [Herbaspirillum sp. WKF16]|jgi:hypothetical protein|uniref:hypothetical protein n=1 Tax=Herbaspirillum sp. WKF16 TaxID=3028312 RepID=UPI0023A9AA62|nr:hypothetical protein [Herbaspirillum sp. WKF16]WDZ96712.1 hypothetical protein Herbaro_02695 [Herbaspirillum sp. WKF16]